MTLGANLEPQKYDEKRKRQKVGQSTPSPAMREFMRKEGERAAAKKVESYIQKLISQQGTKGYESKLDEMLSLYVKNLRQLKMELSKGDAQWGGKELSITDVPAISTSKNPRQAVLYAVGGKKSEEKRRKEGIVGQVYIYVIPRKNMKDDLDKKRAVDILELNQMHRYSVDTHKLTESEITFLTEIPGNYLVEICEIDAKEDITSVGHHVCIRKSKEYCTWKSGRIRRPKALEALRLNKRKCFLSLY